MIFKIFFLLSFFLAYEGKGKIYKQSKQESFRFWLLFFSYDSTHDVRRYMITQDSIVVKMEANRMSLQLDSNDFVLRFTKKQHNQLVKIAENVKDQAFKYFYYNPCVVKGTRLEFYFLWTTLTKQTTLSSYYNEELSAFVNFINAVVPRKFEIPYDKQKLQKALDLCNSSK